MKVAIIMGSTSDLDIMSQAINLLEDFISLTLKLS